MLLRNSQLLLGAAVLLCAGSTLAQIHDPRAIEADPLLADGPIAPTLDGLGDEHLEVTTTVPESQAFIDQGLRLTYGFNHSEALRAFKEAARLDSENAMAYWGWALVLGPNLNLPMQDDVVAQAYEAMQDAVALKQKVSERERDYIEALTVRYSDDPEADRKALNEAYADAMQALHKKYPDDNHAATLYAAALMNLQPWDYWLPDGGYKGRAEELIGVLEGVIERDPEHTGAIHYYIHAVEVKHPRRAEAGADVLGSLAPNAGHLVHMPSHIYMRIGRYEDSYAVNAAASVADENYITACSAQGMYPLGYYPHNIHFMVWSAMFEGRSTEAVEMARKVASKIPDHINEENWGAYELFRSQPYYAMVRFGMWDDMLAEEQPVKKARLMTGIWRYGRALAYLNQGDAKRAGKELKALEKVGKSMHDGSGRRESSQTMLTIAAEIVRGEMAARDGAYDDAAMHLQRAVRLEDSLPYSEPSEWYFPVRHILGAVLLEAGHPIEATVVYYEDLRRNPENGYSLFGLEQSLRARGLDIDADAAAERFARVWARADVTLSTSRF